MTEAWPGNADERDVDTMRRFVLKALAAGFVLFDAAALGKSQAFADAEWPEAAFKQKSEAEALKSLYGKGAEPSADVKLEAPEIAENGAVVPISVGTTMTGVTGIALLVSENPFTLAAVYRIPEGTAPAVSNRLKLAKTTKVVAVVEAGGKLYSASKDVKVTVGGCGG